ncbi:uncharacterized protein LOC113306382 [Papaver somniferum]|uniref:uncharacterized protein LOC113306382 n=1 Tax=Papaver somniferum TaxID=3469 RepID=UPI000E704660|nr:uncharacterized protein LOC113306382 [Papaver somniferum]
MHFLHLLNHTEDSGKLGFIGLTNEIETGIYNFQYFEYNDKHESTTPIDRIGKIMLDPLFMESAFVGSCNGLVCLSQYTGYLEVKTYICNPITKEYVMLNIKTDRICCIWTSGFGYISSANEYKVVRVYFLQNMSYEAYIYALGSGNGWRSLGTLSFKFDHLEQGTFANEALYWPHYELNIIITLDLVEEKFCEHLSFLPSPGNYDRIGVLIGFLLLTADVGVEEAISHDIWLLKKKNNNHDLKAREEHHSLVWSKEFRVDDGELVVVTKSGGVLTYIDNYLNIYDPKAFT